MNEPTIAITTEGDSLLINQHSHSFSILVSKAFVPHESLVCSFLEKGQDMYAAVIAPLDEYECLAHRIVSFLGAYIRIHDIDWLRREVGFIPTKVPKVPQGTLH